MDKTFIEKYINNEVIPRIDDRIKAIVNNEFFNLKIEFKTKLKELDKLIQEVKEIQKNNLEILNENNSENIANKLNDIVDKKISAEDFQIKINNYINFQIQQTVQDLFN